MNPKASESIGPLTPAVFHILLVLAGGKAHGYAIMNHIDRMTDRRVRLGPGTLYRSIYKMTLDGTCVSSKRWSEACKSFDSLWASAPGRERLCMSCRSPSRPSDNSPSRFVRDPSLSGKTRHEDPHGNAQHAIEREARQGGDYRVSRHG